jgi:hypothetical protein
VHNVSSFCTVFDDMDARFNRLIAPPKHTFSLLGVRGVSKSTWAHQQFADALRIDLLERRLYQDLLPGCRLVRTDAAGRAARQRVVLDEVQLFPTPDAVAIVDRRRGHVGRLPVLEPAE